MTGFLSSVVLSDIIYILSLKFVCIVPRHVSLHCGDYQKSPIVLHRISPSAFKSIIELDMMILKKPFYEHSMLMKISRDIS
jgi:hypothetical protein